MAHELKGTDIERLKAVLDGLLDDGACDKAAVIADLLDDAESEDSYLWFLLGRQAALAGETRLAEARLEKCLVCGGSGTALFYLLSKVQFDLGDLAGALDWGDRALKTEAGIPEIYFHLARIHTAQGQIDEAAGVLERILSTESFSEEIKLDAHRRLGRHFMEAKRYEEAIPHLQKALLSQDEKAEDWKNLGHCESLMGNLEAALGSFTNAVEMDKSAGSLYELGDCLIGLGRNAEAIGVLEQAARMAPNHAMINYDLGLALINEGRYEEGAKASRRALADDPDMSRQRSNPGLGATGNLGICLMNQGLYEEALACFDKNLGLMTATYSHKGITLNRMHRPEEAAVWFKKVLELDPHDKAALNLLGQSYDDAGLHGEAVVSLKKAIKIDPKYALGYYDLGVILAKKPGKRDEAMRCFNKALALEPDDLTQAWTHYSIACLHALAGDKEAALRSFEAALAKGLRERKHIDEDKDLDRLRLDPRFTELMRKYFSAN